MSLNERIKLILKQTKVSQAKVAGRLKISDSAVNQKLKKGKKDVDSIKFLRVVSSLTRVPLSEILGESTSELSVTAEALESYAGNRQTSTAFETLQALVESQRETIALQRAEIERLKAGKAEPPRKSDK